MKHQWIRFDSWDGNLFVPGRWYDVIDDVAQLTDPKEELHIELILNYNNNRPGRIHKYALIDFDPHRNWRLELLDIEI